MNTRDAASEISRWVLIAMGLFLLLEGLTEFFSGFFSAGCSLFLAGAAILIPALFSGRGKAVSSEPKKWKVAVPILFALTTLAGFGVVGWFGAAMLALTHEGDIPGSVHSRIGGCDSYALFLIFLLIAIAGAARALFIEKLTVLSWTLFVISACVLTACAVQIATS